MAFGYGVGDFLAVLQLALTVYNDFKNAPGQLKDISNDVGSLHSVLKEAEESITPYNTLSEQSKARLAEILRGCKAVLDELKTICEKYKLRNPALKRWWYRFRWDQVKITDLRDRLDVNVTMLTGFQVTYIRYTRSTIIALQVD